MSRENEKREQKIARDSKEKSNRLIAKQSSKSSNKPVTRGEEVRRELQKLAQSRPEGRYVDEQRLMIRYALERFISRISQSDFATDFVLKGALAAAIYVPNSFRTTGDGDFQLTGSYSLESIRETVKRIASIPEDDGLVMLTDEIEVTEAGQDRGYTGYNVRIPTTLAQSRCNIELDICFGEIITPKAEEKEYPVLLGASPPKIKVYPIETIIAEKFEIINKFGRSNGRLKDYFDLDGISKSCTIDGATLQEAITATFNHRGTEVPSTVPEGLTDKYYNDNARSKEWMQWLKSVSLEKKHSLEECCKRIEAMLMPVATAITNKEVFDKVWSGGAWTHSDVELTSE